MQNISSSYLESVTKQFLTYKKLAERAIEQVSEKDLFFRQHENSNSMALVMKHMAGNMISRWTDFFTTDGEKPWRNRDNEFENDHFDKTKLMQRWEEGWKVFLDTLYSIKPEDLERTIHIRGEAHTVLEALNRQLAHYSYHVGQIVYAAKQFNPGEWNSLSIPKKKSQGNITA